MRRVALFLAACVAVVSAIGLHAQQADLITSTNNPALTSQSVPRLIMFSGTVRDLAGKPMTGPVDLNFAIYKEQTDAAPLWQETQTLNVDEQGHYAALLGAMQAEGLPVDLFTSGEARWMGVSAGKLPEQPRVLLVSVPYALKAGDAETLGGKSASAYMLAPPAGSGTSQGSGTPGATGRAGAASPELGTPGKPTSGPKPNVAGTGTKNYLPLWTDSVGTLGNSVIYQSSGLVGIGTTTPAGKLDVVGSVGHFLVDTSGAQFKFSRGGANYFLASTAGGYFDFVVNGKTPSDATASLKLAANGVVNFMAGNVGIGTLTPAQKLDVSGNLKITGVGNALIFPDGTVQHTAGSGSGGGTITGVTAGTGLSGGGTAGGVTLNLKSASCTAGLALTGLPLTCQPFATLSGNSFTGNQSITGTASIVSSGVGATALSVQATDLTTTNYAVSGVADGTDGVGVYGQANLGSTAAGVWGISTGGTAGVFSGNVTVSGTLSAAVKHFKIDHPLDPSNKFLVHASVESSELKTIYDGSVTLDSKGEAAVLLPPWFQALNGEFRYQLTCVGGYAPVFIAHKIQNNQFKIAGGTAGLEVDWQVTGVRHDAYAQAHPLDVEVEKPAQERGYYLHPELFGQAAQKGLEWADHPATMKKVTPPNQTQ